MLLYQRCSGKIGRDIIGDHLRRIVPLLLIDGKGTRRLHLVLAYRSDRLINLH